MLAQTIYKEALAITNIYNAMDFSKTGILKAQDLRLALPNQQIFPATPFDLVLTSEDGPCFTSDVLCQEEKTVEAQQTSLAVNTK